MQHEAELALHAHSAAIYLHDGKHDSLPFSLHPVTGGASSDITPSAPHPRIPLPSPDQTPPPGVIFSCWEL